MAIAAGGEPGVQVWEMNLKIKIYLKNYSRDKSRLVPTVIF
jgi:hypothetical protein